MHLRGRSADMKHVIPETHSFYRSTVFGHVLYVHTVFRHNYCIVMRQYYITNLTTKVV